MSDSVNCLKMGVEALLQFMEERVTHITGDLIEPLDMYINHHEQTSSQQFEQANQLYHDLYEKQTKHSECKRLYMSLGQESEQNEIDIEKALLSQQQGEITVEKV